MKNTKKKGFTLVELLVVIAIVAILASVSVIGYLSFTDKANLSNDQQMIKMINDNLLFSEVERKPEKPSDAISDLNKVGFTNNKLTPFSRGHHYVYNLEKNKFYLMNKEDQVIYPEENVDLSTTWGFYRNQDTDKLTGINNYVAMEIIDDQNKFNTVFGSENYKIDLNGSYANVNGKSNVTIFNGSVPKNSGFTTETDVVVRELVDANKEQDEVVVPSELKGNEIVVKNLHITPKISSSRDGNQIFKKIGADKNATVESKKELLIENVTFDFNNVKRCTIMLDAGNIFSKYTFRNCIFMNNPYKWTMEICEWDVPFIIEDCQFINCDRGININVQPKVLPALGSAIKNTTFELLNSSKSKAIQISEINATGSITHQGVQDLQGPAIDITGNKFVSGAAAVNLHETLVRTGANPVEALTDTEFANIFNFHGNICKMEGKVTLDDADPFTTEQIKYFNKLVAIFEKNF